MTTPSPGTAAVLVAVGRVLRDVKAELGAEIRGLRERIAALESGAPPPKERLRGPAAGSRPYYVTKAHDE